MRGVLSYCEGLPERRFDAGETLIVEGGQDNAVFVLIEGELEVLRGDIEVSTCAEPGAIFGEMSILMDSPCTASVRAVGPTRVYHAADGAEFLRSNPELNFLVARLLARRLFAVSTYLADIKSQFEDHSDHLGMVDEVLGTLVNQQDEEFTPGSDRDPDPKM